MRSVGRASVRGCRSPSSETQQKSSSVFKLGKVNRGAYLCRNDFPLILLPILMCQPQSLQILLLPHPELLPQALVPHLQRRDLEVLAFVGLEALGDFLPGERFFFLELHEEAVVFVEFRAGDAGGAFAPFGAGAGESERKV